MMMLRYAVKHKGMSHDEIELLGNDGVYKVIIDYLDDKTEARMGVGRSAVRIELPLYPSAEDVENALKEILVAAEDRPRVNPNRREWHGQCFNPWRGVRK